MRILQIAPPWESVPPAAYGGTEAVVHLLCEELVSLGHDVTLCATGDSTTSARLRSCLPRSLRTAEDIQDKGPYAIAHAGHALAVAGEYDVVHNHAGEELMALAKLTSGVPMLTTMHCNISPDRKFVWERYEGYYNTVSWSQKRLMQHMPRPWFAGVAYNAIDVGSFPFTEKKDDYLLFLARVSHDKGPHIAIEVAKRTGMRLIIAGKVDAVDRDYFTKMVEPLIDGDQIVFAGEADATQKRELYSRARCLLMPITWEEPFGLVMAEAQACGTPVIAFNRGAAPEVVRHETTGFVVEDADEMVAAVARVAEIEPVECRRWVSGRFDAPHMAARYVELYARVLGAHAAGSPTHEDMEVMPGRVA